MESVPGHDVTTGQVGGVGLMCPRCEYDLRGAESRRCPECGEAFDPEVLRRVKLPWRVKPSLGSFVRTVGWGLFGPSKLLMELAVPPDDRRARGFMRWVVVPVAVVVAGLVCGGVYQIWGQGKLYDARLIMGSGERWNREVWVPVMAAVDWPWMLAVPVMVGVVMLARSVRAGLGVMGVGQERAVVGSLSRYAVVGVVPCLVGGAVAAGVLASLAGYRVGFGFAYREARLSSGELNEAWHFAVICMLGITMGFPLLLRKYQRRARRVGLMVLGASSVLLVASGVFVPGVYPGISPGDQRGISMAVSELVGFLVAGAFLVWGGFVLVGMPLAMMSRVGVGWVRLGMGLVMSVVSVGLSVGVVVGMVWLVGYLRIMVEAMAL